MNDLFFAAGSRKALVALYWDWVTSNVFLHAKYVTLSLAVVMAALVPFDYLIFGTNNPFTAIRCAVIGIFFLNFILIDKFCKSGSRITSLLILLSSPLIFTFTYEYYLFWLNISSINLVFIANIMAVFFLTFSIHRFSSAQHAYTGLSILSLLLIKAFHYSSGPYIYFLIVDHICSALTAVYFRREFAGALFERLNGLKTLMPLRLARNIVFSNSASTLTNSFKAKNTNVVCLCADWRGFQAMSSSMVPSQLSALMEVYYNCVIELLEQCDPLGNYYFSWVADELFVVFFDGRGDIDKIRYNALKFSRALATDALQKVKHATGIQLKIDIGISDGEGLLGLQGPTFAKKTTITGEVAGRAKRFETEAKAIRGEQSTLNLEPVIVVDPVLRAYCRRLKYFYDVNWCRRVAVTKDIAGMVVCAYISTSSQGDKIAS